MAGRRMTVTTGWGQGKRVTFVDFAHGQGGLQFERSYTPSAVCCPARAMILSGAYHWHNGVYNQVHSAPSVHRDVNPDVVLYSQRLRDVGYKLGYVGKWHASWVRGPLDFGFHEVADMTSYRDAARCLEIKATVC